MIVTCLHAIRQPPIRILFQGKQLLDLNVQLLVVAVLHHAVVSQVVALSTRSVLNPSSSVFIFTMFDFKCFKFQRAETLK